MALNFITGAPGAGKTAVSRKLLARGFQAYDSDDPEKTGLAGWHDLVTGEYVGGFNEVEFTKELTKTHIWRLTDFGFEDLKRRSENERIYLCGRMREEKAIIDASRRIVFMTITDDNIRERLDQRAKMSDGEVKWGGIPWQVERSVAVNTEIEAQYRRLGAIMIDGNQPLSDVVENIIQATND